MTSMTRTLVIGLCVAGLWLGRLAHAQGVVSGELKKWHAVTLTFEGPESSEEASPNPFTEYRLIVTFNHQKNGQTRSIVVPGYYAADGNAAESGAAAGNQWRVHFVPDEVGPWQYKASFRTGPNIAVSEDPSAGKATAFDGASGQFVVAESDKAPTDRDFRGKGMLRYVGKRYLQFAATGEYFLKAGADSPENFLAYADFDGTFDEGAEAKVRSGEAKKADGAFLHRYGPHVNDWRPGDPTWRGGKGKGIIGALNYLAGKGMNSVYFLTYNLDGGDGQDVWPWTKPNERLRFDCSKLDQWEIVFSHMDRLGIHLHVITQETENDQGLNGGELGLERKLYYRELVARFGHHLAITWNLGEENTNTDAQRKAFAEYIRRMDPYDHPIVVHTYPGQYEKVYRPLVGFAHLEGPSLQMGNVEATHAETLKWVNASAQAGRPWFVCLDEIGPANVGVMPDRDDPEHDKVRAAGLWGNLMAGGAGCEWYFGYQYAHNDLNCEDWRSRERMWDQTRHAVEFFHSHLPFAEMSSADDLVSGGNAWCLAKPGEVYALYIRSKGTATLRLPQGTYQVKWYDPRRGGKLQDGSVKRLDGGGAVSLGEAPAELNRDWVVLLRRQ